MLHTSASPRSLLLPLVLAGLAFVAAEPTARADRAGQAVRVGQQRGAGAFPFFEKERVLDELALLRDEIDAGRGDVGDREHALEKLDHALEELEESLELELWVLDANGFVEGRHLDPEEGAHVFNEERHCAQYVFDAIDDGEIDDPELVSELMVLVETLVFIDRSLAQIQIDDAVAEGGDPEELDEAFDQFERGDRLVDRALDTDDLERRDDLLYEAMDNAYRHAWEAAIDAIEDGREPLTSATHGLCGPGLCGGPRAGHRRL
ncbi:MAG TPA: hypothetical protein VF530_22515 [Planctomycetota bacterium]